MRLATSPESVTGPVLNNCSQIERHVEVVDAQRDDPVRMFSRGRISAMQKTCDFQPRNGDLNAKATEHGPSLAETDGRPSAERKSHGITE